LAGAALAEEAGADESDGFWTLTVVVSLAGADDPLPPPHAAARVATTVVHSRRARVRVRVMRGRIPGCKSE
jgi:hypothetical protein